MKKVIAIILIFSYTAMADDICSQSVTYLTKGTASPCTGYLFSPTEERGARLAKEQLDALQTEFGVQTDKVNLLTQDISFYKDQNTASQAQTKLWQDADQTCSQELKKDENNRFLKDMLFFGAGILTVLIAGLALKQVSK